MILDPYRYRSGSRSEPKSRPNNEKPIWAARLSASTVPVNEKNHNFKCCIGQFFFVKKVQSKLGSGFQIQKKKSDSTSLKRQIHNSARIICNFRDMRCLLPTYFISDFSFRSLCGSSTLVAG